MEESIKKRYKSYKSGGILDGGMDLEWLRERVRSLYRYEGGYLVNSRGQELRGVSNPRKGQRFLVLYRHGKQYRLQLHKVIYFYVHGRWPRRVVHMNGDRCDNRIENLRGFDDVSGSRAHYSISGVPFMRYDKSHSTSGCVWGSRIKFRGRLVNLGNFGSFAEAKEVYDRALEQIASLGTGGSVV